MAFKTTLSISGMTCGHCEKAITSELTALPGVTDVVIGLVPNGTSTVTVTSTNALSEAVVRSLVAEEGYGLVGFTGH